MVAVLLTLWAAGLVCLLGAIVMSLKELERK